MTDEKKDEPEDTRTSAQKVGDGGHPRGDEAKRLLGGFFDVHGDNFLGSGMTFHEWSMSGDLVRYRRFLGLQARDERRRRMKYVVAMSVEHDRICQQDRFATFWSEACIEAVINGDWDEVKMWAESLKFKNEGPDIRNIAAPKFANFVKIALEAYETRPTVFCPICYRPAPPEHVGAHHDGRHVCPWCKIVHDDEGNAVEQDKANVMPVDDPEPEFTTEPEEDLVAEVVESVSVPEELLQDAGPTGVGQQPEPEPEPEPVLEDPRNLEWERQLRDGVPIEYVVPEPEEDADE